MSALHKLTSVPPQIAELAASIRELCGDDDLAFADTLDGETDVIQAARATVRMIAAAETMEQAAKALAERYGARAKDFADRGTRARAALGHFMSEIAAPKLTLPEATVTLVGGDNRSVTGTPDVDTLPADLVRVKREPDRTAIKATLQAGREVPGCTLTNGAPRLQIRTK